MHMNNFQLFTQENAFQIKNPMSFNYQINNYKPFMLYPYMTKSRKKIRKNKFTKKEDEKLCSLVKKYGENEWTLVSKHMENRNPRQCRERWKNCLNPIYIKNKWSDEEDFLLLEKFQEIGPHWNTIAQCFPNRSMYSIRNRIIKLIKICDDERCNSKYFEIHSNDVNKLSWSNKNHINSNLVPNCFKDISSNSKNGDLELQKPQRQAIEDEANNMDEIFDIFWDHVEEMEALF